MKKTEIAAMVCVLLISTGCTGPGTGFYAEGVEALEKKDYYLAAASFEASIREEERLPEAYRGAGIAYLRKKEYEKAEMAFADSLEAMQGKSESFKRDVLFYTIEVKEALNKKEEALELCDRLLEIEEEPDAFFLKGKLYLSMDEEEQARECFEQALALTDDTLRGTYEKGRIYYYLYDFDNAKKYLSEAVDGGEEDALLLLGRVYLEMEETENAGVMYTDYLKEHPKSAVAYNGLVLCDLAEKEYEQALEHVAEGLACQDESVTQNLLYNEIIIYEYQQDYDTARAKMEEYLAKYPDDETAAREYLFLQSRQEKEDDENV